MPTPSSLPDLLDRSSEVRGEEVIYRFANGLTIKTEIFNKDDKLRILPLGSPQGSLMNHMLNFPEVVRDKSLFEPFAGSGALGFMALKVGARHVDFLDINPKASVFQRENARLNQFPSSRFRSIEADIATFEPEHRYQLFPGAQEEITRWRSSLIGKHGEDLSLCHYVARVGPRGDPPASCVIRSDFAEQFGESFLVPSDSEQEFSIGRAFENFVPSSQRR